MELCDALRADPRGPLVQQVGDFAKERHASDISVMISVARLYMETNRFIDAQAVLVAAGKQEPREGRVYRWLGEVLLRRGDADRADKVFERAIQLGSTDAETRVWLQRAKSYRKMQSTSGAPAVAADIMRVEGHPQPAPSAGVLPRFASVNDSDQTSTDVFDKVDTGEIEVAALDRAPPPAPPKRPEPPRDARPKPAPASTNGAAMRPSSKERPRMPPPVFDEHPPPSVHEERTRAQPAIDLARAAPHAPATHAQAPYAPPMRAPASHPPATQPQQQPAALGKPHVPHTRDVLDALTLAGLFEPPTVTGAAAVALWDQAGRAPKRKGGPTLVVGMVLFLAASVGVYFFYQHKRALQRVQGDALLATVEDQLHAGKVDALSDLDGELLRAMELESRSPRAALDWVKDRAMVGLLKSGADVAFEDAMGRAKDLGVPEDQYAFAHVASFLFQGDTAGAAGTLGRWDKTASGDSWYELLAGAALERAGDVRARDRYATAAKLEPELFVAKVALARATAIDGDAAEAMRLARALRVAAPDRVEPVALAALAWGRDPRRDEDHPPPEADEVIKRAAELPAALKFVPPAITALGALDKQDAADTRTAVSSGLALADSPGVAVWLGTIALGVGDEALGRRAALAALQLSAAYEPARALAARVALIGGRIDEALKATEDLDPTSPDVTVVHAAAAYERVDLDGVTRALEGLPPEARKLPMLAPLDMSADVLSGRLRLDRAKLITMAFDDAPWGDLIAMDLALDDGDLSTAGKIAAHWGKDAESQPRRAIRLARLARYDNRLDAADTLSEAALLRGTVTARVLWERAYVLVAKGRSADVGPLLARYPLVLGPLATWLSAYATAAGGNVDLAKAKTASTDPPPQGAPLDARVVAAAALGAMKDRRHGADYVKAALAGGVLHPDLVAAALALGLKRVEHGKRGPTFE
jgi:tetratricopeptide (TPR) repeat protein